MISPTHYSFKVDAAGRVYKSNVATLQPTTAIYVNDELAADGLEPLGREGRDLFIVGTSVLTVDRLALRKPAGCRDEARELQWQRHIDLDIAIEQPEVWEPRRNQLESLLRLLTDDQWSLKFSHARPKQVQAGLFSSPPPPDAEVALYSGGLDSNAGMYVRSKRATRNFVAVSIYGDNKRRETQRGGIAALTSLGVQVQSVSLIHQIRGSSDIPNLEPTQRSRAVAYLFLGAAVARTCGLDHLASYEAGPGALNLPMNDAQVASQNTRATHPEVMRQAEELLQITANHPNFRLDLPFLLETKGEVCAAAGQSALKRLADVSFSCDEGENRKPGLLHCGYCTSCLLRRAALHNALGSSDPTTYRSSQTKNHGAYDIEAFTFQALAILRATSEFKHLLNLDPLLRHAVAYLVARGSSEIQAQQDLCALLRRHARESLAWLDLGAPFSVLGGVQ